MFSVIEDMTIGFCKKYYEYHQTFFGEHATIFVFSNDYDITRGEMIESASRFMHGNYIRYDVDLHTLLVTKSKGLDKTTPLH